MKSIVVEMGAWRAGVHVGELGFIFEERDRLLDREAATALTGRGQTAVAEIRRNASGVNPWALVSGRFVPSRSQWFSVGVGQTGPFPERCDPISAGPLGRELCVGLPDEFSQSVMDGLLRFDAGHRPSGRLDVVGAGFDVVDSSEAIFEVAAGLLKWALLTTHLITKDSVSEFLAAHVVGSL